MFQRLRKGPYVLLLTVAVSGYAALAAPPPAVLPPSLATAFSPAIIAFGNTTALTFTTTNTNLAPLTGVGFTDTLPAGLTVPNASASVCGGTVTLTAPSGISMSGATVIGPGQCQFSVTVTGAVVGNYTNTTSVVTSNEGGNGNSSSASLTVTGSAPTLATSFNPASINPGDTTALTFTISNANGNALTGVGFTDTLPTNLTVPNASATVCGGTVTLTAPSGISMTNATVAGNNQCQFSVTVTGNVSGHYTNTTSVVTSNEAGSGAASSASLTVNGVPPTITTSFNPATIALGSTTALTFTITNPAGNTFNLTGVGFTDTLPTGLSVPNASATVCGGTVTLTAPTGISMTGATINQGTQCQFSVTVTGNVVGNYTNTTSAVTSANAGTGLTSSASMTVTGSAPTITVSFNPAAIVQGGTTAKTFTITNPAPNTVALTGVAFTDTLPTGLTVPNASAAVCGGTVTLTAPTTISMTGATINANSNCQFSVTVTGVSNGSYTNTTGAVTSTNGGTGNTASANLIVGPTTITLLPGCPAGGNWSNSACWNLGRAPISGDDVAISGTAQPVTNYDLAGVQLHSLTISGAAGALNVTGGPIGLQTGGTVTDSFNNNGTDTLPGLTLNGPATFTVSVAAETLRINGDITGTGGLTKTGIGTLLLTGANTYSGTTQVNGGTLNVSGSTGAVTAGSGGTLTGTGTVASISALSGGIVSGNLSVSGGVVFAAGSSFNAVITNGSVFSRINATGTVDLSAGPTLHVTLAPGFSPPPGTVFVLVPGAVAGGFSGLGQGAIFTSGATFRINYASVTLTVLDPTSIPTLSWWGLALLAALLAAVAAYGLGRPGRASAQ
jgi:uncharacterized repeat protein (TIGR01451 family)